jgi:hypothetical protein
VGRVHDDWPASTSEDLDFVQPKTKPTQSQSQRILLAKF